MTDAARQADRTSKLVVYRASAGSGKTFTLAVEYISLLMDDPTAYRNILAVTFTNKATAEMKERILSQLYGISVGDADSKAYLDAVRQKTGLADTVIMRKAGEALGFIIHDYSRFHVETMDTFSVSVMRNLAKELGVGMNMNIELNSDDALSEAVDAMIENTDKDTEALDWISEYITERMEEDKNWRVFDSIKSFGKQIFNEQFVEKGETLRRQLQDHRCVDAYKKALQARKDELKRLLKGKGDEFFCALTENGIGTDQLNRGDKGPAARYFRFLQNGDIDGISFGSMLSDMMEREEAWTTAGASMRKEVMALANSRLKSILSEAEDYRGLYISCILSLEHINDLRLLTKIDGELERLNSQNNRFLLPNINKLLHKFVKDSDTPFVFEKLGASISNVMMDEFQDTSRLQWRNFKPLLVEGLAGGSDSLIVGDVKQSIYRWRNGDWNILNSGLDKDFAHERLEHKSLHTNRRSASDIIAFNNELFPAALQILNDKNEKESGKRSDILARAYEDVRQSGGAPGGYVRVSFIHDDGTDGDESYTGTTLRLLAEQVRELKAQGMREKDMAILVRKKKSMKLIADHFGNEEGDIRLVSDEAFRLEASTAIGIIVEAMRCLSLPNLADRGSKMYLAPLAMAYQQEVRKGCADTNTILLSSAADILNKHLPSAFSRHTEDLRLMPLYELAEKLRAIFNLSAIRGQDGYMLAFFDALAEYCDTHAADISDFVSHWDDTLRKKTLPAREVDGIRILTIHKAKGLEFHTVLIPFCDWTLSVDNHPSDPHKIWCKPQGNPYDGLNLLPVRYRKEMSQSIYGECYKEEKLQLLVDSLNLLYVAFTRPRANLFVWSGWHRKWDKEKNGKKRMEGLSNISKLLMDSIRLFAPVADTTSASTGKAATYERGTLRLPETGADREEKNRLLTKPTPIPVEMPSTDTAFEFRQSNRSAEFISGESGGNRYIDRGLLLHHLFSRIRTKEDIPRAAERLRMEGIITSREEEREISDFAHRAVSGLRGEDWFDGSWRLFNECSIIYTEDGQTRTRRPDRVMMKDGRVVVLDYKFGKKNCHYRQQVREYMDLIKGMGYSDVKGYLWYVFDNDLEEVGDG